MNIRKQKVLNIAHQLFIEKGYQATSIQDILESSGISKGTFYNYFSSKSELLMALFKSIFKKLEQERNELLIGQDPSDVKVFIKQVELHMNTNKRNKLLSLFQEVLVLNDPELNNFMKRGNFIFIDWVYTRFLDLFGDEKKPYLLDCAIMFLGILQHNFKFNAIAYEEENTSIQRIVRYSVERIVKIVEEVSVAGDQLIRPEVLENWLPSNKTDKTLKEKLYHTVLQIKMTLNDGKDQTKPLELLNFVLDEVLHSREPRKFLIESALDSLKSDIALSENEEMQLFEKLVLEYLAPGENAEKI
ncbi:transcriptional regulator, TetR family [Schinkia azotoformans MEV2011]|uniref:Transcriptional regulator, TetR family n=1 Tax=Schinkia azotoformans MEV2011 TaxID=1348973 RepID=A0A072NP41_SCHAZ|nr:TetR/AcrR family transcriptional regulator [Schinkia azotoformans]KEF39022.1 transcriptional regulator, TetR family [Schinkia azotoformans MEV2011]MEC1697354.1 TetR/AcrR family transcriptional regulator [Schinkia azotoformans]MEC1724382.1 TetR/AcrR family transcriptional regulator [Schinkia azotoformans]MEC1760500.1 TetR/AcrR family transcriptional regulator [Schinkia azotoformans]MEC1773583.1 TetR/AcrR family transcriptional regulator [Schinkia azotoformans]